MRNLRRCVSCGYIAVFVLFLALSGCNNGSPELLNSPPANHDLVVGPAVNPITLVTITTGFNTPVGIDHHQPTNQVVLSVNYPTGSPYNFELVAADGSRAQFSAISGFTDEIKIATARTTANGFTAGELFTGNGVDGEIARISADGTSVINPWVSLPGAGNGLMRGSLYIDRTGVFGGDLVVATTGGEVWRITSAGVPTLLVDLDVHLEGLVTVPSDAAKYGPWAGKILTGAEGQSNIWAIDIAGTATPYALGIQPEDIEIIPANQNFFGVNFGGSSLMGAGPAEFTSMVGDILIAQEFPGYLWHVSWNGASFDTEIIAEVPQWEHVTFSTAGIKEVPPVGPTLDIHPTSCPNPFSTSWADNGTKPSRGGVMPVALVGSDEFDVTNIDPSTILLEGVAPLRWATEDVTQPAGDEGDCPCTTAGGDGIMDLTLKFSRSQLAAIILPADPGSVLTLTITGELYDGTAFSASDCVIIRGPMVADEAGLRVQE